MPTMIVQITTQRTPQRDFHYVRTSLFLDGGRRDAFGALAAAQAGVDYTRNQEVARFEGMPSANYKVVVELLNQRLQPVAHLIHAPWTVRDLPYILPLHFPTAPPHIDLGLPPVLPRRP